MVHVTAEKRASEKFEPLLCHESVVEERSSTTASSWVLGCVTALAVRVLPGLAPSSPQAFVTRRRPLAPPVYCMYVVYGWGGDPKVAGRCGH